MMQPDDGLRLCVLGAGEVGRGWAALAAAHGCAVAVHDPDPGISTDAELAIRKRVAVLLQHGLAEPDQAERGLRALAVFDGVESALGGAGWIIEAAPESPEEKRAILATAEAAAPDHAILASSSSGLHASALAAGLRRPERVIVVHPLVPVELIPVVEVVPGPETDPAVIETVRAELERMGRTAIVLRREVPGNAVGRVAAAVWRECIDLVLEGVLDPAEADRLVAGGPSVGWAAGGPHLTYELAATGGMEVFLDHLQPTFESWWAHLSERTTLNDDDRRRLIELVRDAYGAGRQDLREARDRRLIALVRALSGKDAPR